MKNRKRLSSFRRVVGPKRNRISVRSHPGGDWAVARVQALNPDGVPGKVKIKRFRLAPPKKLTLKQASRRSANSARRVGGRVKFRTLCPLLGHCQNRVLLKLKGRTVGELRYQQVSGSYRMAELAPKNPKLRRLLAQNRLKRLRIRIHQHRIGEKPTGFEAGLGGS